MNIAVVLSFDAAVLYFCGVKSIVYLLAGTVFGGGLHPMAGHLISEHYMFVKVIYLSGHIQTLTDWLAWLKQLLHSCVSVLSEQDVHRLLEHNPVRLLKSQFDGCICRGRRRTRTTVR